MVGNSVAARDRTVSAKAVWLAKVSPLRYHLDQHEDNSGEAYGHTCLKKVQVMHYALLNVLQAMYDAGHYAAEQSEISRLELGFEHVSVAPSP